MAELGPVAVLRRYPVKSMLGEQIGEAVLTAGGVDGDRVLALIDAETGRVASAKQPKLWRGLLKLAAAWDGRVTITLPDARTIGADDSDADRVLSDVLGRQVHLSGIRAEGAALARPAPEDVIAQGDDAELPFEMREIGRGTPGATFVDYAPVHLVTTASLDHVGADLARYRPNIVVATSGRPYRENEWAGREITVGQLRLRGILPTPRCAIPTLEHGALPRATHAVRTLLDGNRVDVPGFGVLPCLGLYAEVLQGGTIRCGDTAVVH